MNEIRRKNKKGDASIRERIYITLRDQICYGILNPGERLIESNLSKQFNSSRSPIREALRQLESEDLVTFERNKGITVSKLSIKTVDEIYNIRSVLEGYAAGLAVKNIREKDLKKLTNLNNNIVEMIKSNSIKKWIALDSEFYFLLYKLSGNNNLKLTIEQLNRRIFRYKIIIVNIPGHNDNYIEMHKKILDACANKNEKMAEESRKQHLLKVKEILLGYLKAFEGYVG